MLVDAVGGGRNPIPGVEGGGTKQSIVSTVFMEVAIQCHGGGTFWSV